MQDFYRTPEFCAACHKANLPNAAERLQVDPRVYRLRRVAEFEVFAAQSADFLLHGFHHLPGLPHEARASSQLDDYGAKHGTLASHRWPAGNTAVPFYYGFDEQLQKTVEFLKSGNYLNVDLFGIRRSRGGEMIAPLGLGALPPDAGRDRADDGGDPEQEHRPLAGSRGARPL